MANGMIAGIYNIWIAKRTTAGYPMGTAATPDSPTVNTQYAAYRAKYPVSFTPPTPTRETAVRAGGQAYRGTRDLGLSGLNTGSLVMDGYDETFHALVSGSSVDTTTLTGWSMTAPNTQKPSLPQFVMGVSKGFQNEDGTVEYLTTIFNSVQIRPTMPSGSQGGGTNPNPLTYEVVVDTSTRTGIGRLYSASGLAVSEDSDVAISIRYTREIYVVTFIGNAAATTTTLPYLPTSSDATGAATNSITVAGATTAVTSISTSTGVVTFASAPASAAIAVIAYPTAYVAP